jgi:kynurenine formamidase
VNRIAEARAAELFEATKNWGRWGEDDERGALNLLTPEHVAEAAALVRTGDVVSCGRELPVVPAPDNPLPAMHHMTQAGDALSRRGLQASSDFVGVSFHGMAVSHIDALCHVFVDSEMYNGFPASLVTSRGARRNSIEVAFGGIAGRGVLLDVPRVRGVDWIEPGETITPDDLDAACAAQRVTVESGDLLLISTGRDARRAVHGPWDIGALGLAGLDPECVAWLHAHDPAVLGSDGVSDVLLSDDHKWQMLVHLCLIVGMGVHLLDNLRLDRLAAACAAQNRWEFLFVVSPLQIGGGTGSPVNPIAIL